MSDMGRRKQTGRARQRWCCALLASAVWSVSPLAAQSVVTSNAAAPPALRGLAGEPCTLGTATDLGPGGVVSALACDGIEAGSLVRFVLPTGSASAAPDRLGAIWAANRPRIAALASMSCQPVKAEALPGWAEPPVLIEACRNVADGWPHLVVVAASSGTLTAAVGPAAAAPALVAMASGRPAPDGLAAALTSFWPGQTQIGTLAEQDQVRRLWSQARRDMARLAPQPAEAALRQALATRQRLLPNDPSGSAGLMMDLAVAVALDGRADEADALMREAETATASLPDPARGPRQAVYRSQLAAISGDAARAAQEAAAAVALWRPLAEGEAGTGGAARAIAGAELAMALNLEATAQLKAGDPTSAAVRASEALVAIEAATAAPPWWRGDILATLGEATASLGRIAAAEKYFQAALKIRSSLFGDGPPTMRVWVSLARSYQAAGLPANAVASYRRAVALAAASPRDSSSLADTDLIPFAQAVDSLLPGLDPPARQGLLADLFAAFQLSRAPDREHSNSKAAARLAEDSPALASLLRRQADLAQMITDTRLRLVSEQAKADDAADRLPADALTGLSARLADGQRQQAALEADLASRFPQYLALTRMRPQALDEVRARLSDDEALAQFLIGRDRSYVLLLRRNGLQMVPVALGEAALADMVRRLRRGLEIEGGAVGDFDLATAHDLYRQLLEPADLAGVTRLTIIPAGPLSGLPFSLLVTAPPMPGGYADAAWLVRRMAISHAPSLTSHMALRTTQVVRHAPRMMLAVANPALSGRQSAGAVLARAFTGCRGAGPVDPALLRSLVALPDTAAEAREAAMAIGVGDATMLTGEAATELSLRGAAPGDYRILYFATHGLIPGELQCQNEPGLVLTPPAVASATTAGDGLLSASEIVGMELRADLVVLSACNTATPGGRRTGSGALSGLAEAFFRAGARTVLASHWQVPSAATSGLMKGVFTALGSDHLRPVDEALRAAQLASLAQPRTAHPFFWGAFVVIGDGASAPLADRGPP